MAAAAAASAALHVASRKGQGADKWRQSVPVHLKGLASEIGDRDPVSVIENLSRKDSKSDEGEIRKLTSHGDWLPTRLIATKARLLLLKAAGADASYDIVDSIPLHEISALNKATDLDAKRNSKGRTSDASNFPFQYKAFREKFGSQSSLMAGTNSRTGSQKSLVFVDSNPEDAYKQGDALMKSSIMELHTLPNGFNQGKVFLFDAGTEEYCTEWLQVLDELVAQARVSYRRTHAVKHIQGISKQVFESDLFQVGMVLSMGGNFFLAILHAQVRDENLCAADFSNTTLAETGGGKWKQAYDDLAIIFTVLFVAEVLVNFVAHAFWRFWKDVWNIFDVLVIIISVGVLFTNTTNNIIIKQLRILRALRVAKVFGRIGNIREIATAITSSIIPAAQALLIGLIVVAIYAVIGREFYGQGNPIYFCDFFHAFYTMFGVVALGTNPVTVFDDEGRLIVGNAAFVYSYVAIVIFILLQVVVAVLLESFYKARQRSKEEAAKEAALKATLEEKVVNPLDSILEELAAAFDTSENLDVRLQQLFDEFDVDGKGAISFTKFAEGLFKAKRVRPQIEDFVRLTDSGKLCNKEHEIEPGQFRIIMRRQLKEFVQRKLSESQFDADIPGDMQVLLNSMKLVMVGLDQIGGGIGDMHDDMRAKTEQLNSEVTLQREDMHSQGLMLEAIMRSLDLSYPAATESSPCASASKDTAFPDDTIRDSGRPQQESHRDLQGRPGSALTVSGSQDEP